MKNITPRGISLISASAITSFFLIDAYILQQFNLYEISLEDLLISSLFVFISCFFVIRVLIGKLIFNRIDKIYQIIHNYRRQNPSKEEVLGEEPERSDDWITDVEEEVYGWAKDRKNEIDRLQQLERYRKEFLGNVSHELKTPIFNIQGYILTLLDGGLEDPAINRNYLQRAEKSVDRMISIIGDLEAISQLETGQLEIECEKFDIVLLVKDIFESLELKASLKGIMLRLKDTGDNPVFVNADRFRIRQVLINLIVNSINYGKEYGETRVKFYDSGDRIIVEVSDNGIGIAKEHLPRLFERFYRADKSRSREQGGTGLGLAIVKHIIEAHGQTISVTSTEGAGTVFSFTLEKPKD